MNFRQQLEQRISAALSAAAGSDAPLPAIVKPAGNPKFGDYQANGVMAAAKAARTNPRALAEQVLARLDLSDLAETVEVAGPGFLNIALSRETLRRETARAADDPRLDVAPVADPQTVVVDYSAPNLAKEMHVGHLRSTIIGDALARTLEFLGHRVVRQNHVGDWGTQFGMLVAYESEVIREQGLADLESGQTRMRYPHIPDMEEFYRQAKQRYDADPDFAEKAREYVVRLQGGDRRVLQYWEVVREQSLRHAKEVYAALNVSLTDGDIRGESAYNDDLSRVVADLEKAGLLTTSEGARCVFLDEFKGKEGEPLPVIVQKSDGGYLYATTDLAALRYRAGVLHADRVLYLIDSRQALHLAQVFAVGRKAGFVPEPISLEHIAFGTMQDESGRPFKTRTGGTVKLMDLLNEAIERAFAVVAEKSPDLPAEQQQSIARAVGIGAVKYADLAMDRTSDYKFSFDRMLSLQGNTAPYMQYAYARVRSIFRKGQQEAGELTGGIELAEPAERELAVRILRLEEVLAAVASECKPNILTGYLFELATAFSTFYESCPVLKTEPALRASRLRLCDLTARVIARGLELLGIEVIEQM